VFEIPSKCYDAKTKSELFQTFIWIRHRLQNGGYFYALYGHIKPYENIKDGTEIKAGEGIGTINNCYVWYNDKLGSAPHLHFGIWNSDSLPPTKDNIGYGPVRSFVNPIRFMQENKPYAASMN
jgi:murein DD-endopeptidase MepM/ murein hydrolase activator NlpD